LETVAVDYAPRGVKFYYIYKALAHPENNGYIQPFTLKERLLHVQEAKRTLGSGIEWICDNMDNGLKAALGGAPNSEFIIDPAGKIIQARGWSNATSLRTDLESLVGKVSPVTSVADLKWKPVAPQRPTATGVVSRIQINSVMKAVQVTPLESDEPYYVKLRAEVDESFMSEGLGMAYLGFHLDPLLHVHWNNLAAPIQYRVQCPVGITMGPGAGRGPEIKVEADGDPREFLVGLEWDASVLPANRLADSPITIEVDYFACHDDLGWCKPIRQQYEVRLLVDRNAGSVRGRGGFGGGRRR